MRFGFVIMLIFAVLANLTGQELQVSPMVQTIIPLEPLVEISPLALGLSAELGTQSIFDTDFGLSGRLGFTGWIASETWTGSLGMLDLSLLAKYKLAIDDSFYLSPHLGIGVILSFLTAPNIADDIQETSQNTSLGMLFLLEPALNAGIKIEEGISLNVQLGWRFMLEAGSAYNGFLFGMGIGLDIPDARKAQLDAVISNPSFQRPQDIAMDAILEFENINVFRSRKTIRIVLANSFLANDAAFTSRLEEELPAIANYISLITGLKSIEVLAYVADDRVRSNEVQLSNARAKLVADWLQNKLAPQWQSIPSKGMGKANPIADNSNEEGRKKNRRLEIVLTLE